MEQKPYGDKIKETNRNYYERKFIHDNNIKKFYCIMLLKLTKTDNESLPTITCFLRFGEIFMSLRVTSLRDTYLNSLESFRMVEVKKHLVRNQNS